MSNKRTTMQDIADALNISKVTVSKAFSDSSEISESTKKKIFEAAKEMNYVYKSIKNKQVVVFVSPIFLETDEKFYTRIYKYLTQESLINNVSLSLKIVSSSGDIPNLLADDSLSIYDGFVILGELPKGCTDLLVSQKIPTVFIDFYNRNYQIDTVVSNNFQASYEITSHLIDHGHKDIVFVGNIASTSSIQDRYLGYYKAFLENNIPLEKQNVMMDRNESGEFIDLKIPDKLPTAFVCNNDYTAYKLIRKLQMMGYSVPQDISVVGFDDVHFSPFSSPKLTTVEINLNELARVGLKRLLGKISNKSNSTKTIVIDTKIKYRESVAEARKENL